MTILAAQPQEVMLQAAALQVVFEGPTGVRRQLLAVVC